MSKQFFTATIIKIPAKEQKTGVNVIKLFSFITDDEA
jgi:hypothetical protein